MDYIDIGLMATPRTYLNGKPVCFPYQKAEALFYYVAVEKVITRDQVTAMFWAYLTNEAAKQNMRQTLYVLKKTFGSAVIKSLPNHQLGFSDTFTVHCDLDDFYEKREIGLYQGEIFHGLFIRNAPLFEKWITKKRESARTFFLSNYLEYMQAVPANKLDVLENFFNRYVKEDPLDERAYAIMLEAYLKNNLCHKGISLYQKLCTLLERELGAGPAHETTALYHKLLNKRAAGAGRKFVQEPTDTPYYAQTSENRWALYGSQIKQINDLYLEHQSGSGRAILLSGEYGVGKSSVFAEFLAVNVPKDALVIKITCYMKNKEQMLQPWNDLILQLNKYITEQGILVPYVLLAAANKLLPVFGIAITAQSNVSDTDYDYHAGKNSILQILLLVARHVQIVILFGNIHAMDALSLDILASLVHSARQEILILCTCLDTVDHNTESFISAAHNNWQLCRIHLYPMPFEKAEVLIRAESGSFHISDAQIKEIYEHSQGNWFFARELLWNVKNGRPLGDFSPLAQDMLCDQLNGLSKPARQLLDLISVFAKYVVLDELCLIEKVDSIEISQRLEQLKERGLILEKTIEDRVCFLFSHCRMRDFIYSKIPAARRRRLHDLAGMACEQVSAYNLETEYHFMVRHYSLAGNRAKALSYRIQMLYGEVIPDYKTFVDFTRESKSELSPQAYLQSLLEELHATRERQPDAVEYDRLETILLLAQSRCCLLGGEIETGVSAFSALMDRQHIWANPSFLFRAFLQLMDYIVQNSGNDIDTYMEAEYERIKEAIGPFEKAAFKQLQVLLAMLTGDKDRARRLNDVVIKHLFHAKQ